MNRAASRAHVRIEFDLAKGVFVVDQVLLEDGIQSLSLLWAEIYTLEVLYFDAGFVLLLQSSENQKEIPDIHPHLHAVGVIFAVIRSVRELDCRLNRICHDDLAAK